MIIVLLIVSLAANIYLALAWSRQRVENERNKMAQAKAANALKAYKL